jgi:exonuclease SbcD
MKFAHLADCHIGGWREEKLRELGIKTFEKTIDICIERNVGFVLISGDLFNTALPQIELIKEVAGILNKLKEANIDVYMVPGSHDFSPSGKTMLDVFEESGLVINVMKVNEGKLKSVEDKTGVKITGILGRRGGLEKNDYAELDLSEVDAESGFKIFMFHTALEEFKPEGMEKMEGQSVAVLPKNFNYYAGGHVHYIFDTAFGNGKLVFPGALFPNNFLELEKFKFGGFYIVSDNLELERVDINLKDVVSYNINADSKTPDVVNSELKEIQNVSDKIVTVRIHGVLESGRVSDIDFSCIEGYCVLKNVNKLSTKEFEEIKVEGGNIEEIEEKLIKEHLGQFEIENEEELTRTLMKTFSLEKLEGEKVADFEKRVVKEVSSVIK